MDVLTHSIGMRQEVGSPALPGESNWRFIPWGLKLQDKTSRTVKRAGWALLQPHIPHS